MAIAAAWLLAAGVAAAQTTGTDNEKVCWVAVSVTQRNWNTGCGACRPSIAEAQRRGLSLEQCLAMVDRYSRGGSPGAPAAGPSVRVIESGNQPPQSPQAQPPAPAVPFSPLVHAVQRLLAALGLDVGPIDGVAGPQTIAAVRAFQRAAGLPVTGVIDNELHSQLATIAREAGREQPRPGELRPIGSGTGFFISADGLMITNNHVVGKCKEVRLARRGQQTDKAELLAQNANDDLALLKVERSGGAYLKFRAEAIRPAEPILVFGFGGFSSLGNTTLGHVSAVTGPRDTYSMFQISAPINPGNSGGAVLDMQGRVVGVIRMRGHTVQYVQATRSLPQGLNFAIKATSVIAFLDAQKSAYDIAPSGETFDSVRLAEIADSASAKLLCLQ